MLIESDQNPKVKQLIKLQSKSRERKATKSFVVEGLQENRLALASGFKPISFYTCADIYDDSLYISKETNHFHFSLSIFSKVAYRKTTGGVLGVYQDENDFLLPKNIAQNATFIILEGIEKPGNLGAILRSCDASACNGVILVDSQVDFFNPNVIRSSVGTVFTNNLYQVSFDELIQWQIEHKIDLYATHLNAESKDLYSVKFNTKSAFLFGTENSGISDRWMKVAKEIIKIPMMGKVDSLNLSNSVAICLYERLRQRDFC